MSNDRSSLDESGITVGELIKLLSMHPKDDVICFGQSGRFTFNRVKDRGGIAQIELTENTGIE